MSIVHVVLYSGSEQAHTQVNSYLSSCTVVVSKHTQLNSVRVFLPGASEQALTQLSIVHVVLYSGSESKRTHTSKFVLVVLYGGSEQAHTHLILYMSSCPVLVSKHTHN